MKPEEKPYLMLMTLASAAQFVLLIAAGYPVILIMILWDFSWYLENTDYAFLILITPVMALITIAGLVFLNIMHWRGNSRFTNLALVLSSAVTIDAFLTANLYLALNIEDWGIDDLVWPVISLFQDADEIFGSELGISWGAISANLAPFLLALIIFSSVQLGRLRAKSERTQALAVEPCRICGADNRANAKFCTSCGIQDPVSA